MLFNNYLYRSTVKPLFLGIGGCTFLLIIDTLAELLEDVVVRGVSVIKVIELLSYHATHLLSLTVPMGVMIGTLVAYGSISNANEVIALNSLGINLNKIIRPIIYLSFIITLFLLFNNQFITPVAAQRGEDIAKMLAFDNPSLGLAERQFIDSIKGYSIYLEKFDPKTGKAENFILFANEKDQKFANIVKGDGAFWNDGYMAIREANSYEMDSSGKKKATINFGEQLIPIRSKIATIDLLGLGEENQLSLTGLYSIILKKRSQNIPTIRYELALQMKLSLCFAPIVMAILGALLSVGAHKRFRRGDGKLTGIAVLFCYWVWIMTSRGLIISNGLSPLIMWFPNIVFLIFSFFVYLYKRRV